jgi:hypothetical protein
MTTQLATALQENPSFDTNTSITFYRWLDEHKRGLAKGKKFTQGSKKAAAKATRYVLWVIPIGWLVGWLVGQSSGLLRKTRGQGGNGAPI